VAKKEKGIKRHGAAKKKKKFAIRRVSDGRATPLKKSVFWDHHPIFMIEPFIEPPAIYWPMINSFYAYAPSTAVKCRSWNVSQGKRSTFRDVVSFDMSTCVSINTEFPCVLYNHLCVIYIYIAWCT
jgi:hypothetical protein